MIPNIQILRGVAAINVAFYHVLYVSEKYSLNPTYLSFFKNWGQNGVDIFFVISGFIIFYTQKQNKKKFLDFLKQRLLRIVPIYWLLTLIIVILSLIDARVFSNLEITTELIFSSFLFLSILLNKSYPILNTGWSLEYEMFFYLSFAFFLLFKKTNIILILLFFFILILFSKEFLFAEFLFGVLLGYFFSKFKSMNNLISYFFLFLGILIIILSISSLSLISITNHFDRMIYLGIPATMIVFGLIYIQQGKNIFFIFLGNASYSIYLVHLLIISAVYKFSYYYNINMNNDLLAIGILLLSVLGSCIFYLIVEKKINLFLKNKFVKK